MTIAFSTTRLFTQAAALLGIGVVGLAVLSACDTDSVTSTSTATSTSVAATTAVAPRTTELPPITATETVGGSADDAIPPLVRVAPPITTRPLGSGPGCLPTDQQSVPGADAATIAPPSPGAQWSVDRVGGTVCPGLSWAALSVLGATGSSPWQLLIYHNGYFLGTGTRCNLPYQSIVGQERESVTVAYRYITGDEPLAAPRGRVTVTYRWNGSRVVMDGTLPTALTGGKC